MTLTNFDLENLAIKYGIPNFKVIMNDEITTEQYKNNSYYIVNLEDLTDDGSHWVSVLIKNNKTVYFDSFGVVPSLQVEEFLHKSKKKYMFNNKIIQDLSSTNCGLFCLGCIIYAHNSNLDIYEAVDKYCDLFSNNTKKNDKIINKLFVSFH